MTLPIGANAGDDHDKKPDAAANGASDRREPHGSDASGTSIEPAQAGGVSAQNTIDIEPFLAAAAGERIENPKEAPKVYSKLLDYSAHAAMIVGLLGFAWTLSAHTGNGKQPEIASVAKPVTVAAVVAPTPAKPTEAEELRLGTQKMASDLNALRLSVEALRSSIHADAQRQDKTTEQIKSIVASIDSLKSGLGSTKSETSGAIASLSSKIDHLPHDETATKIREIAERLDKMERSLSDQTVTASLPKPTNVALPPQKPAAVKAATTEPEPPKKPAGPEAADAQKKPQIIPEWVVREVDDGVAIIESKRGQLAVEPGVNVPGAGVVKSIERHNGSWTVTTTKGQFAYVPQHEQTSPRDYPPRVPYYRGGPDGY